MSSSFTTPPGLSLGAAALAAGLLAVSLLHRTWRNAADRAFIAGTVGLILDCLLGAAVRIVPASDAVTVLAWCKFLSGALIAAPWLVFGLTYARGNADAFVRRWRPIILASVLVPLVVVIGLRPWLVSTIEISGTTAVYRLGWSGVLLQLVKVIGAVLVLMNLERTVRAAVGTNRWRIKFVVLGLGVLFLVRLYTASQALVFRSIGPSNETVNALGTIVGTLVLARGLFRAPRFTSDVYPSLSVLQGSITITIAGAYLFIVGVFANVVAHMGGDASFALKAFIVLVSLVALAVLIQSDRLRMFVRRYLSRHFQRPVYDYRSIWRQFSSSTAACVEEGDLCRSVVRTTADILQALSVSVWLLNDRHDGLDLGASTSLSDARGRQIAPTSEETLAIVRYFKTHPDPIEIETQEDVWADALRRSHPPEFTTGGNRICVPLLRQQELVGVLIIGDRVSGVSFPMQDFDLLKCIADQTAASLLNIQLSQRLLVSKELEAFQTMAAFFVHDLKNAASTLNLMLKNLPVHFDNPEFRADALRGMEKAATHINRLTSRLSSLRHELKIQAAPRDLNEVVTAALESLAVAKGANVTRDFSPVAITLLDSEQLQKVITNLVLNAIEASPPDGDIRVATAQQNGSVILTVSDHGSGMSEEFLRDSLFRPFKTTKQHGLGIGMFQSRMIIEAHGGRIQVSSQAGQGSTFQVILPVRPNPA